MATGGTIPSNRTQTVTFYNTCGVIEKDKAIYLAPRFKKMTGVLGMQVRNAFLQKLTSDCPPPSAYTAINLTGWSPRDRTLVVKGNIDDFRLVTEEGDCLNYFVVTRNVTKVEGQSAVTRTYYYGFFVTDVEQVGGSSVRVTAEPDDFTNVFYLHNSHVLTSADLSGEYEPFNERMKNCFVQRQHYNRVMTGAGYWILDIRLSVYSMSEGTIQEGEEITLECEDADHTTITGEVLYVDDRNIQSVSHEVYLRIKTDDEYEIGEELNFSTLSYNNVNYSCSYSTQDIEWEHVTPLLPVNREIFLNQEESFRYKYQYRDKKIPYLLTEEDLETIKNTATFASLSNDLKLKILRTCLSFLVIETKSTELFVQYYYDNWVSNETHYSVTRLVKNGNMVSDKFNRPNGVIAYPFYDIPDLLKKYETEILAYDVYGYFYPTAFQKYVKLTTASEVFKTINTKAIADWIYSAYIVRDIMLWNRHTALQNGKFCIIMDTPNFAKPTSSNPNGEVDFEQMIYFGGITNDPDSIGNPSILHSIRIQWGDSAGGWQTNQTYLTASGCLLGIIVSGFDHKEITLNLKESIPDLKNNYYDPVLEAEPYSFYSLSFLNFELPFNKNRYYTGLESELKLKYFLSINGAVKCSVIPLYNVELKEFYYFNEGLIFTIDYSLPLSSDSYSSYYYVNKAQMKNQFAVNDYNRKTDLAQHFFVSGPNAVGVTASKRGGWGALAETGNQVMQMVDEAIDWAQSDKVIEMNQKAKLADVGAQPDALKQTGTDALLDLATNEGAFYVNHYTIDSLSYNSISKLLERVGYQVNLYASLNVMNRVGWNYVKLNSFDWNPSLDIMKEQEDNLKKIFNQGVTLLHDKSYLTSGHNYETILDE